MGAPELPGVDTTLDHGVCRPATAADADAMAAIFAQGRAETFDAPADVAEWVGESLVAEEGGRVVGFARLFRADDRCAQAGVGEYAIYVDAQARGHGTGTRLLEALVRRAQQDGFWKLGGRLFTTNTASAALARRCGFRAVGVQERQGRVDGEWKDVLLVERLLG
jgi:phosphinothricin acetyltransferase